MANFVLLDQAIHVGGYDLTTHSNQVALTQEVETQDSTTFGGGGFRSRKGGLKDVTLEASGFHDSDPSTLGFTKLGIADEVVTLHKGAASDVAYFFRGANGTYETLGAVGEMNPYSIGASGSNGQGLVRGLVARVKGNVSATGSTGVAVNCGAGGAGKYLYAAVHVFSAGTTLSVKIESDSAQAFSTPADVASATITGMTAVGGYWMTRVDATSITDTWFRFNVTACTGTFSIAGVIAVQ